MKTPSAPVYVVVCTRRMDERFVYASVFRTYKAASQFRRVQIAADQQTNLQKKMWKYTISQEVVS